jgi:hypothetical protein
MKESTGIDYSGGRPHPEAIKAAGHKFVVRYLTAGGPGLPGKLLLPDEYQALVAAGVAVVANFETTADRMKYGAIAGAQDARVAQAAIEGIGMPSDQVVYLSADWDAQPHEYEQIDAYLTAAGLILGPERIGVYGSYSVVKHCLDTGTAKWAWQTGAWSRGRRETRAHIYQRIGMEIVGGVACDVNEALTDNFGQHPFTSIRTRENFVTWRLERTKVPLMSKSTDFPDGKWPAVEDVITFPGPVSGWPGREIAHVTFGLGGGWVQEAWAAPSGKHFVTPDPGLGVTQFSTINWEAPPGSTALILRYAAPAGGSVTIETEH